LFRGAVAVIGRSWFAVQPVVLEKLEELPWNSLPRSWCHVDVCAIAITELALLVTGQQPAFLKSVDVGV